jgi:hypothetical protein
MRVKLLEFHDVKESLGDHLLKVRPRFHMALAQQGHDRGMLG